MSPRGGAALRSSDGSQPVIGITSQALTHIRSWGVQRCYLYTAGIKAPATMPGGVLLRWRRRPLLLARGVRTGVTKLRPINKRRHRQCECAACAQGLPAVSAVARMSAPVGAQPSAIAHHGRRAGARANRWFGPSTGPESRGRVMMLEVSRVRCRRPEQSVPRGEPDFTPFVRNGSHVPPVI